MKCNIWRLAVRYDIYIHIIRRLKVNNLCVQERNLDILSFFLKKSQQVNPLQVPQWGP